MNKSVVLHSLIMCLVCFSAKAVADNSFTAFDLVGHGIKAVSSCYRYVEPTGTCFWFDPPPFGTGFNTTNSVMNYTPQAVSMTYNQPGEMPWTELRLLFGEGLVKGLNFLLKVILNLPQVAGGTHDDESGGTESYFKEAAVWGFPFPGIVEGFARIIFTGSNPCNSPSGYMRSHFQSELDAVRWRNTLPLPSLPNPTDPTSFFPRVGTVEFFGDYAQMGYSASGEHPAKQAQAFIQQATGLATGDTSGLYGSGHNVTELALHGPEGWESHTCQRNEAGRGHCMHQIVAPTPTSAPYCGVIGDLTSPTSTKLVLTEPLDGLRSTAAVVWRCTHCCRRGKGIYVGKTPSPPRCP